MSWNETDLDAGRGRVAAYIPTLDGWRAIAVCAVVLNHFWISDSPYNRGGDFGVAVFFALSGYLITRRLVAEYDRHDRIRLGAFYMRRAFRILPAAIAYLLVVGVLARFGVLRMPWLEWLSALTFWRNYYVAPLVADATIHFWTLSVEEHFYLFWPALLAALGPKRVRRPALALALTIALWRWFDTRSGLIRVLAIWSSHRTDHRLDSLLYGCLLALALQALDTRRRFEKCLVLPVWIAAVALCLAELVHGWHLREVVLPLLYPVVIAYPLLHPAGHIAGCLEFQPLRWLGRISYSVYLWQGLFAVLPFWQARHLAAVAATLACASASYYLLELPVIRVGYALAPFPRDLRAPPARAAGAAAGII